MTAAIVWLILWFLGAWIGGWAFATTGTLLAIGDEKIRWVVIGWIIGIAWWIFAIVHAVLQVVDVIRLI